jgi:hypothetical protein
VGPDKSSVLRACLLETESVCRSERFGAVTQPPKDTPSRCTSVLAGQGAVVINSTAHSDATYAGLQVAISCLGFTPALRPTSAGDKSNVCAKVYPRRARVKSGKSCTPHTSRGCRFTAVKFF